MNENVIFIYRSNGNYLGFISDGNFFSRDGVYWGWVEGDLVWHSTGKYAGELKEISGHIYIIRNMYRLQPIPKSPKKFPDIPTIPDTPRNIRAVNLPIGYQDAFI